MAARQPAPFRAMSGACGAAIVVATACGLAAGAPDEPLPAAVWYRFESRDELGRSSGVRPWPACVFRAEAGAGRHGGGLVLPGRAANGLLLPNPRAFFGAVAEAGTIALWVKPEFDPSKETGQRVLIDFMKETRNTLVDGYEIVVLTDRDKLAAQAALGRRMVVPTPLARGRWTHVALSWHSSLGEAGSALYVDGKRVAERKGKFTATPLTSWPGRVGSHTPSGGYPFKGAIDELRLFRAKLGPGEIESLARAGAGGPKLDVVGWDGDALKVTNRGGEPVRVWLREWLAEPQHTARCWGYLPLPEHEVGSRRVYIRTAGAVQRVSRAVAVGFADTVLLPIPRRAHYTGWRRLSVMVGEKLACQEAAARDHRGLVFEVEPRVLYSDQPARIKLRVRNDTGRPYAGRLAGTLRRDMASGTSALAARQLRLRQGETASFDILLSERPLSPSSYRIELTTSAEAGRDKPRRSLPIYVTENVDYRSIVGVGAAYVEHPVSARLLGDMANHRVKVLRRSPSRWWTEEPRLYMHRFKAWYTAACSSRSICTDPERMAAAERVAGQLGACLKDKPLVLNQVMLGEGLSRPPCYCENCSTAFRAYLRAKYGRIGELNRRWGSTYKTFDHIHQLGSPADVDHAAERMALMQRKLPQHHAQRWRELFRLDPSRAIAWKRWHDGVLIDWYARFARAFHKANGHETALSEQPCWPNFKHHVLFRLGEIADLGGMDLYLPGELPTTLGYASELFCNFDLNASVFRGKPLWLHELYVQDNSPAGLAGAQGWWLVGRGYTMLTYFTYDYYHEGTRAGLPLVFGLFDKAGKKYPCHSSFWRFSRHLRRFHQEVDVRKLRRVEPRVALFLGDDVSLANWLETGGETWNAAGVHGHIGAYWLTERKGYPVEFVNDAGLARLEGKKALIVPWTHVVRRPSLEGILAFARSGGTVIFDGPVGLCDEVYRPYSPLPGGKALAALGIQYAGYRDEPNELVLQSGARIPSRGIPIEPTVTSGEVLAKDAKGNPAVVSQRVGKGRVYCLLTSLGRTQRSRAPDRFALGFWRELLESAGIRSRCRFTATKPAKETKPKDAPLCDVSLRSRGDDELFVFIVNFFKPTRGEVTLRLRAATYEADDALSGWGRGIHFRKPVPLRRGDGGYSFAVDMPAFGARVISVRCTSGPLVFQP